MTRRTSGTTKGPGLLGIECGGTRSAALFTDGQQVTEWQGGPANLRLLDDPALRRHLRGVARALPRPAAVAIGMAGALTEADRERIRRAASAVWPGIPCLATHDLETALAAAPVVRASPPDSSGGTPAAPVSASKAARASCKPSVRAAVLVRCGTGSCCYGRSPAGRTARMGGWGHLLGDKGSGYEIGLRALKAAVFYYDRDGEWSRLGQRVLRALQLNAPEDLIGWAHSATKTGVAALAVEVFAAAAERDKIARDILEGAAHSLAKDAVSCALKIASPEESVRFVLAGGVLLKQPKFARSVAKLIAGRWPGALCAPLQRDSVWGAVELARTLLAETCRGRREEAVLKLGMRNTERGTGRGGAVFPWDILQIAASPTEQRNPRSRNLDRLATKEAIRLMLSEDAKIPAAIRRESDKIAWVVERIARAFKRGGRLFYAGAGTSGRLGVLDASECPPTFHASPEMVQAIMAGGQNAIWTSVEGAEDDPDAGARAVRFRGVRRGDVLVGIAASGRTPFVWGALWEAKRRDATTVLLCFNPNLRVRRADRPHRIIAPNPGPEILTGSTRLKAGTATKLILNMFTTLAMVRIGKVVSNLMVDVAAANTKLRDRATRITCELTGADYATAQAALAKSGWQIRRACAHLSRFNSVEKPPNQSGLAFAQSPSPNAERNRKS